MHSVLHRALLAVKARLAATVRTALALARLFALELHATLAGIFIYAALLGALGWVAVEFARSRTTVAQVPANWIETAGGAKLRGTADN